MLDQDWLKTFAPFGLVPQPNRWQPTGACVFISHEEVIWCVTAAHVLTSAAGQSFGCMVTINGKPIVLQLTESYKQMPGIGWIFDHSSDLAAGPMPMPAGIDIRSIGFDRCLEQKDLIPSMRCLTAGQPYGLPGVDPNSPTPLILDGVIAGLDAAQRRVFVSVPTFPGNSGGPIIAFRTPWNTGGGMTVGLPTVFLAGVVTRTVVIPNSQPDKSVIPPLHLGMGATIDAVKALLTSADAVRMLGEIRNRAVPPT